MQLLSIAHFSKLWNPQTVSDVMAERDNCAPSVNSHLKPPLQRTKTFGRPFLVTVSIVYHLLSQYSNLTGWSFN